MKNEIEIESVTNFIEQIKIYKSDDFSLYLYRGQEKDWELQPKILRHKSLNKDDLIRAEEYMLEEFKRKASAYLGFTKFSNLEWLAIAQHYGMETRLLDWTENPLTALWFCINYSKEKYNGVVYQFRAFNFSDDYIDEKDSENPFELTKTKIYKPSFINERIINQTSIFTVHNIDISTDKNIGKNIFDKNLKKFIIPYKIFENIKNDLNVLGINSATIFPDLSGLCLNVNEFLKDKEKLRRILSLVERIKS